MKILKNRETSKKTILTRRHEGTKKFKTVRHVKHTVYLVGANRVRPPFGVEMSDMVAFPAGRMPYAPTGISHWVLKGEGTIYFHVLCLSLRRCVSTALRQTFLFHATSRRRNVIKPRANRICLSCRSGITAGLRGENSFETVFTRRAADPPHEGRRDFVFRCESTVLLKFYPIFTRQTHG